MTLSAGTRLGSYQILRPIGAGGMGEVYRARDTKLSRDVAVKVLPAALAADAERVGRFEKEARTASALNHPNIVTIYEIGQSDGISFIAMELVEGKTLRELLAAGALPLKKILALAAQAADGLARAHAAGIVHRDLKPENLMITKEGFVKILDFGLAKLVPGGFEDSGGSEQATMTRGTEAGTILGTVGYMSPEQASGEPADFRSDQFSLGAILYEMAAGKRAFERPTAAQTLSVIIEGEPEPLATVAPRAPNNLVWIVERCLSKDPEERYGSTKDLARDLAAIRDHSSISISAVEARGPRRLRVSRIALAAGALSAAAVAALTFFAGQRLQARSDREAPPPPQTTLTFRRGFLTGARFAPDGQTIVYSAAWDGKPSEIFMTRVGSSDSRPLGIFPAGILAISSAGEMAISLGCENRWEPCFGTLARVPLAGGTPREVIEGVGSADWSPDGKDLAAIHHVEEGDRIEYPIG
ncbi:MAG: serine/threonine-protein kinase, partial [Acidobacteriota bacterium]